MFKKLIFFINFSSLVLLSINELRADEINIVPLKKPELSVQELNKKVLINILKPLAKPTINTKKTKPVEVAKKKIIKPKFLIPKKKPLIAGIEKKIKIERSKFYSKKDFSIAKKALSEMKKSNWTNAIKIAKKAKDKSIYNFIQWRHLLTAGNKASFYDYLSFIDKNKDYPRIGRLRYLAEHKLSNEKISPGKIINWFQSGEPLSGYGKMILGESFILTGNNIEGTKLIKEGWVTADLNRSELKYFRKKFKKYLDAKDYVKRADHLAWNNKYWDLKRMLRYLPKDYELLYTARQILMSKSYGVDNAIKNVPTKLKNDAGLNYDRLKWRRKRGRVDDSLEIIFKVRNNKDYLVRPDKWWTERAIMARALIYKKKYESAYKVASKHTLDKSPEFAEAEWMSGWIALSFLNDPILAIDHFNNFYQNVGYPISLSRGAYWLGKSYEKIGDKKQSQQWYEEATKYLTTYYGQLAHLKIKPNENFELKEQQKVTDEYRKYFYKKELVKIVMKSFFVRS